MATGRARAVVVVVAVALVAAGCGLLSSPVHSTPEEVLDALEELRGGARLRLTGELAVDEDELRSVLRDDPEALELFRAELGDGEADVDALLADLEEARATLAEHALLLETGADGSVRAAATHLDTVWVDLRAGTDLAAGDDPTDGFRFDLQLRVDWATAAELFSQPDLLADLDAASEQVATLLGDADVPELGAVRDLALAFLAGELVGVGGEVGPDLVEQLGSLGGVPLPDDPAVDLGFGDPRQLAAEALTFSDFRVEDGDTLVDVTFEVRAVAERLLDQLEERALELGMSFEDVEEGRAQLDDAPERLTDVATLRFGRDGVLREVRVDLLDIALQTARAGAPDDEELAVVERVAGALDRTGAFLVVDVEEVGATETVLGDPAASVSPDQLGEAFGALFLLGAGGAFGDTATIEGEALELPAGGLGEPLAAGDVAVGDCFDEDALLGFREAGAPTTVPCDEPHDHEAYASVQVAADSFDELFTAESGAYDACLAAFEPFVGTSYAESEFFVQVLLPDEEEFSAGAREAVCHLTALGPVQGSAAGTGR